MELKDEKLSRALSAYPRRHILRLLAGSELSVKDIASKTNLSISLASRHLQLLADLGLLATKKDPPFKYYSLKIKEIKPLLEQYDKVIAKL
jgi:DNA-binding transcriptional ArsR family regulator